MIRSLDWFWIKQIKIQHRNDFFTNIHRNISSKPPANLSASSVVCLAIRAKALGLLKEAEIKHSNELANLIILLFTLSLFLSLFPLDESDKLEG